jgi:hypothetical protein
VRHARGSRGARAGLDRPAPGGASRCAARDLRRTRPRALGRVA